MLVGGARTEGTLLLLAVFREPNRFLRQTSKRTGSRSCGKWAVSQDGLSCAFTLSSKATFMMLRLLRLRAKAAISASE
ncbi:hypothetical protein CN933_27820 [Sinorhizobium sp. M4_45]|nr:hypothetical protein CN933_27820 [Sinorhizobium sp. M4_45]